MREEKYPGADLLRTHPMADDQELLRSLNRAERDALVQAIVSIYNPEAFPDASVPAHQEPVPAGSADESDSAPPQITGEPGAADLLLP
jgi:hypothetical protein